MNREELLKAAQAQSDSEGEFERSVLRRGVLFGTAMALFALVIMDIAEYIVFKRIDYGKPAILMLIISVSDLFCGFKIKDKKTIIKGIVFFVLFILCLIFYIGAFIKWIHI